MRITSVQHQNIKNIVSNLVASQATIVLFGSRVDDAKKGGDVDVLIEVESPISNPALLSAKISVAISNLMYGRKVDVLLIAPNLEYLPIHKNARLNGIVL